MPPTLISSFSLASAIGINTDSPNKTLTVVGDISASGYVYGDGRYLQNLPSTTGGSAAGALPLSGGQLTGFVTSTSSISAQGIITANNIATNTQMQFLTGSTFVKVYQFYNTATNSLDTVFN